MSHDIPTMTTPQLRVFLIDIVPPSFPTELIQDRLEELESLVTTYRWVVIVKAIQKRSQPDYRTYVWSGKLDEIKADMIEQWANLLIIWNIMKPWQVYNVSELFRKDDIQVRDRVDLILKIFERHATSTEARLQIELAAVKHMWPRIFGMGMELSRQGWGIGGSGIGETNTERMKRHLKDKVLVIQKKLEQYKKVRSLHRAWRLRKDLFTVWIVWYTNAGKSALMHSLTGKDILVENKLFATLWTAVGEMKLPAMTYDEGNISSTESAVAPEERNQSHTTYGKILINDTVWFIRDLPPDLIDAFASTLEDSVHSQILLHVIDASDSKMEDKIQVVEDILARIEARQKTVYVFNKIDVVDEMTRSIIAEKYAEYQPLFVSAVSGEGLEELKKYIMRESTTLVE